MCLMRTIAAKYAIVWVLNIFQTSIYIYVYVYVGIQNIDTKGCWICISLLLTSQAGPWWGLCRIESIPKTKLRSAVHPVEGFSMDSGRYTPLGKNLRSTTIVVH